MILVFAFQPPRLLFQTGYLTMKEIAPYGNFILNYPNEEVKHTFEHLYRIRLQQNASVLVTKIIKL